MLSILIPVYNYKVTELVTRLHDRLIRTNTEFEILVFDDCSPNKDFSNDNQKLNQLSYCSYKILPKNIGRSAIRNQLSKNAKYDWCLFLDADVIPIKEDFIHNYLQLISEEPKVVYGGIRYPELADSNKKTLRWYYGKKREALIHDKRKKNVHLTFLTLNFLIHKNIFNIVKFNEDIPNLRHEDTLFSFNLMQNNIKVEHVENPVFHLGIEDSKTFLKKSLESVEALNLFVENKLISPDYTLISRTFAQINKLRLTSVFSLLYRKFKSSFESNLLSQRPSLFVFDLYRLSYYCHLNSRK